MSELTTVYPVKWRGTTPFPDHKNAVRIADPNDVLKLWFVAPFRDDNWGYSFRGWRCWRDESVVEPVLWWIGYDTGYRGKDIEAIMDRRPPWADDWDTEAAWVKTQGGDDRVGSLLYKFYERAGYYDARCCVGEDLRRPHGLTPWESEAEL